MNCKRILCTLALFSGLLLTCFAQEAQPKKAKFDANRSMENIRADYGLYSYLLPEEQPSINSRLLEVTYTRRFWRHLGYRVGAMISPNAGGYSFLAGVPVALDFCPGTMSFGESVGYAAGMSVADAVVDGLSGHPEDIGSDILGNLLLVVFRRVEFYGGVTPAWLRGAEKPFACTADLGLVVTIPIWRFGLNFTPAYHYALTQNVFDANGKPVRSIMTLTGGISYLF